MSEVTFGSRHTVSLVRSVLVILLILLILWHPQAAESPWSLLVYLPLTIVAFLSSRLVFARLVEGGLEYLRFGKLIFVDWKEVEKAKINVLGQMTIQLYGRPWWRRHLFLLSPSRPLAEIAPSHPEAARLIALFRP